MKFIPVKLLPSPTLTVLLTSSILTLLLLLLLPALAMMIGQSSQDGVCRPISDDIASLNMLCRLRWQTLMGSATAAAPELTSLLVWTHKWERC